MDYYWRPYVPVGARKARALLEMAKLRKSGAQIQPVKIEERQIARSFWGHGWCKHLESFSDYSNRLPRGRTYVRNGSVCHLAIDSGHVEAIVSGSELYRIEIQIKRLAAETWTTIKAECAGQIGSVLELLRGSLSEEVMRIVTDRRRGLFPMAGEIEFTCDCPDWAVMCKHVAAVLYGVGNRLDREPELLFRLRGVDPEELIASEIALPAASAGGADVLADEDLGAVFGIEIDTGAGPGTQVEPVREEDRVAPAAEAVAQGRPRIRPTGKSVARLRKRLGLSVAEFATRLGVTAASVYRWEATTGRLTLRERTLRALGDASAGRQARLKGPTQGDPGARTYTVEAVSCRRQGP